MLISYSRKELRSIGNYENVTFEVMAQDKVDWENESKELCYNRLKLFVDSKITESFVMYKRPNTKHVDLEHEVSEVKSDKVENANIKTNDLLDEVRVNIAFLMDKEPSIQYTIKDMLKTFEVNTLSELEGSKLVAFNRSLKEMKGAVCSVI